MTSKKRLAIVSSVAAPYRVSQHLRLARELAEEVELWSFILFERDWLPWKHELPAEIHPIQFGKGESSRQKLHHPLRQWTKTGEVIHALREKQIDMVIVTGANDLGLLRLIRWCHRQGIPIYLFGDSNVSGDTATGIRRLIKDAYIGYAVSHIDGLLPCGIRGKEFFDRYGGSTKPCFYMPHEPDYRRLFAVTAEDCQQARKKYGLAPDKQYILYSGRLVAAKGIDTLINAFTQIAEQRPDWNLMLVGGGELEAELKQQIPPQLAHRVVWTGFIHDQSELSVLYHCAEVFVLPSRYEPWAVVVCEAAAAGLVLITSDMVGAGAELCRDGVNGAIFPAGNSAILADKLLWATENRERLWQLRRESLKALDDWR